MDDAILRALAMHDDEEPRGGAQAEEEEAVLLGGVIRVVEQQRGVIAEDGLRLLERDAVLALVRRRLRRMPGEAERLHAERYIRRMYQAGRRGRSGQARACAA